MTPAPQNCLARARWLPAGIASLLLLGTGAAAEPSGDDFSGAWRHVGGKLERREVRAAIDAAVGDMSRLLRGLARSRLREGSRVPGLVTIHAAADEISIREGYVGDDGDRDRLASPPGQVVRRTVPSTGDDIELLHVIEHGMLVQYRSTPEGGRRIRYRLAADGRRLLVEVLTSSHYLPAPVTYRLTYERVTLANSAVKD